MYKVVVKHTDSKKKTTRSNSWYPTKETALNAIFCIKGLIAQSRKSDIQVPTVDNKVKTTSFYRNASVSGPFEEQYKK